METGKKSTAQKALLVVALFAVVTLFGNHFANAVNLNSSVVVGNAAPTVSNVKINNNTAITLTANTTTSVAVSFTVTDSNGCGDVFYLGNVTTTAFRTTLTSACSSSNINCYISSTSTHSCANPTSSNSSANATTTFLIYYFANATDASSSFSSDSWTGSVSARDSAAATHSATSSVVELNTLTAINVTTSSIAYGAVPAGTDTAGSNQVTSSTNAGNSTTTLQLYALSTLTSGVNSIATTSQRYATSSFTFPGGATQLTASAVTVSGFNLTPPTSTSPVWSSVYWGLEVPGGTPTGTYTGQTSFLPLWIP